MKPFVHLAVALSLAAVASAAAQAQDTGPAGRIARFIDPDTLAVVRIDLERLEVPRAEALFRDLPFGETERAAVEALLQRAGEAIGIWQQLGAREAFYVFSLADLPRGGGGFLVIPGVKAPDDDQLGGCEIIAGALVCAQRQTVARLKEQAAGRRLPAAAFEAVKDSPVQLVLAPSEDHRRVLREMSPTLPAEWGGLSGELLVDGFVWGAVGVQLSPRLSARAVVQSQDAASAQRLQQAIRGALEALGRSEQVRAFLPDVERAVRALTPAVENDRLVVNLSTEDPLARAALSQLPVLAGAAQETAQRQESQNNLKQLGIALHNFHDTYGGFPPSASYDAGGKPLLSWRVYLLPYVDADELYQQFRLDEPWDSEHNRQLVARMPPIYASPDARPAGEGRTTYVAPVGESTAFTGGKEGIAIGDITDGSSQTIMLIEVPGDQAVIWTKPEDWQVDLDDPLKGLFPEGREVMLTVFCDGAAHSFPRTIDAKTLRAVFTRNGGEPVGELP